MDRRTLLKGFAALPSASALLRVPYTAGSLGSDVARAGQPAPEQQFSSSARWIWDSIGQYHAWWMFRRTFTPPRSGIRAATLLVTSCQYHLAYVNGQIVDRGPAPS